MEELLNLLAELVYGNCDTEIMEVNYDGGTEAETARSR
jgi:hypothetical protein